MNNALLLLKPALNSHADARPNENCVDTMTARNASVSKTMIDPVRFRYSSIWADNQSPRYPPERKALPDTSIVPRVMLRIVPTQTNNSVAPNAFVPRASTCRHQK